MIKKERGVTLVALVITIIVLLILAGVSIAMLTGDNGLLTKATASSSETKIAEDKEAAAMDLNAAYAAYMEAKYAATTPTNAANFTAWLALEYADSVTNAAHYLNSTSNYTYTAATNLITTVNKNKEGKQEKATVNQNGGTTAWENVE